MNYIVSFTLKNFRSYKEGTTLSFSALDSDYKRDNVITATLSSGEQIHLLKVLAIYGANASGKSNIIWALNALISFVRSSYQLTVDTSIPYEPFLLNGVADKNDISLSIDFIVNGEYYTYSISYNGDRFTEEILLQGYKKKTLIFDRNHLDKDAISNLLTNISPEDFKLYDNHLLLSECANKGSEKMTGIYRFFTHIQSEPVGDSVNLKRFNERIAKDILKNSQSLASVRLSRLLTIADNNISSLKLNKHEEEDFQFPTSIPEHIKQRFIAENQWEIEILHKGSSGEKELPIEVESTGTKRLFGLGGRILDILNTGGILAYDEMNIALHPELFKLLVSFFFNCKSNPHNAQLVMTTHETALLQGPESLLRADQIWFAEKGENGQSDLFSAQDFKDVPIVLPFEAWYRNGRFGALPSFANIDYIFEEQSENISK